MRRVLPAVAAFLGIGLVMSVAVGMGAGMMGVLLLVASVAGLVALVGRGRRAIDPGWRSAPVFESGGSAAVAQIRGGRLAVARSLARVESRELIASPWTGVGFGLSAVILLIFGFMYPEDSNRGWPTTFSLAPILVHPLVGMLIVGAHRNRSRAHRDGCDETFDACPVDQASRSEGHLLTALVGAAMCLGFIGVLFAAIASRTYFAYGPIGVTEIVLIGLAAVLGAGGVALGVALGRWAPVILAPLVALVGIAVITLNLANGRLGSGRRALGTAELYSDIDVIFYPRHHLSQTAWLVGLLALVAAAALFRPGSRGPLLVAGAGAALAVTGLVTATRPMSSSEAERIADRITSPLDHASCARGADLEVCVDETYADLGPFLRDEISEVVAALPDDLRPRLFVQTFREEDRDDLPGAVRRVLGDRAIDVPPSALRLAWTTGPDNVMAIRLRVAARAVGLPSEPVADELEGTTVVAGESRGVLVLWLATRGMSAKATRSVLAEQSSDGSDPLDATDRGSIWPGSCSLERTVLQWAPTDLLAARRIAALPEAEVLSLVEGDWDRLVAPSTTTDELLDALGLDGVGAPAQIEHRAQDCG